MYFILIIVIAVAGAMVSGNFRRKFARYAQIPLSSGLSGKEVAEKMLRDNGIYDVRVQEAQGMNADFYDPSQKTVNLSGDVYHGRSISAAAVAAHECGHAVQHARSYAWLNLRTAMVPIVNVANSVSPFLFFAFLIGGFAMGLMQQFVLIYIGILAITTLFSFITLPVETDASRRALAWLDHTNITRPGDEQHYANDALRAAAYTYVVAALGSLTMLLYWIGVYNNDR